MSNERERLAREWAESKLAMPTGHLDADVIAAAEHIMATTTPLSMADVEWDDEKHRGAGATDTNGRLWVMLQDDGVYIGCVGLDMERLRSVSRRTHPERQEVRTARGHAQHGRADPPGDTDHP